MKTHIVLLAALVCLASSAAAPAADQVTKIQGISSGDVVGMSALSVTVQKASTKTEIAVNEIVTISWQGEPTMLKTARTAILAGRFEDALGALQRIKLDDVGRGEVTQEIEFLKALAAARLALVGEGSIAEAGRAMAAFAQKYPQNYHYLEACEMVGDLLVATGKFSTAQPYYGRLAKAPWPDYKMRAGIAMGKAQLAEKKTDEALESFENVLKMDAKGKQADRQRLAATLGKSRCLAMAKRTDEAVELVEGIIAKADPEESSLRAEAYNALGVAHREAGRSKEALLAFLHVDILYFTSRRDHIEALENLVALWNEVQKPERAADALQILKERYNKDL